MAILHFVISMMGLSMMMPIEKVASGGTSPPPPPVGGSFDRSYPGTLIAGV